MTETAKKNHNFGGNLTLGTLSILASAKLPSSVSQNLFELKLFLRKEIGFRMQEICSFGSIIPRNFLWPSTFF